MQSCSHAVAQSFSLLHSKHNPVITNNIITEEFNELLRMRTFSSKEKQTRFLESISDDFCTPPVKDPMTPEGKALDMIIEARILDDDENSTVVAMNALKIDPDCVDAFNLPGESEADDHKSTTWYKKGPALPAEALL